MPVTTTEPRGTLVRHHSSARGDIFVVTGPHDVERAITTVRFRHSNDSWTPTKMRGYGVYAYNVDRIEDDHAQTQ